MAEYDEMRMIEPKIAVAYKFLSLFKVVMTDGEDQKGLHWSSYAVDTHLSDEVLLAFRAYLKAKRSELKREATVHYGKILWFFYQKLLEVGAFDLAIRAEIRSYLDLCEYIVL